MEQSKYVMESRDETERLLRQQRVDSIQERLLSVGVPRGAQVLDAGCGPGLISRELAQLAGPEGKVLGIDASAERIQAAQATKPALPNLEFRRADLLHSELPDASFDVVWSQFVFQYLPDKARALAELIRILRPGGTVAVSEIDGLGFHNWPMPAALEDGLQRCVRGLARTGFDLYVGRKLFGLFGQAGLQEIRVQLFPLYVVAGAADQRLAEDWVTRFQALKPAVVQQFESAAAYEQFASQ
jgi:SAM-dependent methyltransferase